MANSTIDPIGDEFFQPLLRAEKVADSLFYGSAFLSIASLIIDPKGWPSANDAAQTLFVFSVLTLFITNSIIRLYLFPRAQQGRVEDFLSHAFDKPLSHKRTEAYYNNSATNPSSRIAAQVLESSFFSKEILSMMAWKYRATIVLYTVAFATAVIYRRTDLAWIGVGAQILFSEQVLSRYIRYEWFKKECEQIYKALSRLFQTKADLKIPSVEFLTRYENVKATAALSLSSKVFAEERHRLSEEWEAVRRTIGL